MQGSTRRRAFLLSLFLIASSISGAHAQLNLDAFKNALQQLQGRIQNNNSKSNLSNDQPSSPTDQKASFGASATESYCRNMFALASISKEKPLDTSLVKDEFNIDPQDFFDAASASLGENPGKTSYMFPSPDFYKGEFETDRVNVLYNLLLSYPSPLYAAALVAESRASPQTPQYDNQAKVDALAALAILQYRMQDKTNLPNRWRELVTSIQKEEHYTNYVFIARALASGELGTVNPREAIDYYYDASGLRGKYSSGNHIKSMSERNQGIANSQTLYEILVAHPELIKIGFNAAFLQQYQAGRNAAKLAPELQARLGPELNRIRQASQSASRKALEMLASATEASKLKAEKVSLDSAMRTRVSDSTDANVDTNTMAAIARQLEKLTKLDESQKKQFASALADAHESGDRAIMMMPLMLTSMMNLLTQRGMGAMPAFTPYARRVQAYADNACTVISRWDNAAQVTATSTGSAAESRSSLAALVNDTSK